MNSPQIPRQSRKPGPIVLLIAAFAMVDLVTPAVFEGSRSPELPAVCSGAIAGQLGLLAVWAVLGPQRLLVRWPISLLVTVSLYCVFLFGMAMAEGPGRTLRDLAPIILILPLVFLAAQLPLWILRAAIGCRIVVGGAGDSPSRTESRQFHLQHMLGATTALAVTLGLARLGLSYLSRAGGTTDASVWLGLMIACLVCSTWSAFSTLPCLWAAFVARDKAVGTFVIAAYTAFMSFLVVAIVEARSGFGYFAQNLTSLLLFHGGVVFVLLGSLHLARSCGYVLVRPGRMHPPAASGEGPSTGGGPADRPPPPSL